MVDRGFSISLRSCLVIVAATAVLFAIINWKNSVERLQDQDVYVASRQSAKLLSNGNVEIMEQSETRFRDHDALIVSFPAGKTIDGEVSKLLVNLENLESLSVAYCKLTNDAWDTISKLQSLRFLDVRWSNLTDEQFRQLAKISTLEEIAVGNTGVNPAIVQFERTQHPELTIDDSMW